MDTLKSIFTSCAEFLSNPVYYCLNLLFGVCAYLLLLGLTAVANGFSSILKIGFDYERLFGFDIDLFKPYIIIISVLFLLLLIMFDIVKGLSDIENSEHKGIFEYFKRAIISFVLLMVLPIIVQIFEAVSQFFIKGCNHIYGVVFSSKYGITLSDSNLDVLSQMLSSDEFRQVVEDITNMGTSDFDADAGGVRTIMLFIFLIGLFFGSILIQVALMKRYVEILIGMMFIPFIAISVYNNFDKLNNWLQKITSIFLGFLLNVFLMYCLLILAVDIFSCDTEDLVAKIMLFFAMIAVGVGGPKVLSDYIMQTGTGSGTMSSAKSAASMLSYRIGR